MNYSGELVVAAQPPPSVAWYEGDQLLDDKFEVTHGNESYQVGVTLRQESHQIGMTPSDQAVVTPAQSRQGEFSLVRNELHLPSLTREDLGRRLTCTASNNNQTQPATRTVVVSMLREWR